MKRGGPGRRLVSIAVAAEQADVHPRTIRRWIAAGRLPAFRVGPHLVKIDLNDLDVFIRPVPTATRPPDPSPRPLRAPADSRPPNWDGSDFTAFDTP